MDTGHIDSHQALGINAPESERVQYRKVTTCKLPFDLSCLALYRGLCAKPYFGSRLGPPSCLRLVHLVLKEY